MTHSSVSAVIVSWNQRRFLDGCLDALRGQQYPHLDITVVDNGSTDGSPEWVAQHYPSVSLLGLATNLGFAHAFNQGARHARGGLVLSLNPDVIPLPNFIAEMVCAIAAESRVGMVAPKLLRADNPALLDSTGLFIDRRRRPYDRGQGEVDRGQYDTLFDVFGACGAAALYRRALLEDLAMDGQYFDEGFFAYCEDADLAWRAQLRGWRCRYAPQAIATHVRGWGDTLRRRGHSAKGSTGPRLALRNRYLMTVKNDAWGYFLADLPCILAAELPRLAYAAVAMPGVWLAIPDLLRALPATLRKRRQIRQRRTVSDAAIRRQFVTAGHTARRRRM